MDAFGKLMNQDKDLAQIPDLDWEVLSKDNIPSEFPVEAVPQLQQAWDHTNEVNTRLVSNAGVKGGVSPKTASQEDIAGVVKQAKKEMMQGLIGKPLADKLASLFMPDLIHAAKDELVKLASEQGLLGNVYVDLTPFDSCHEAAVVLGKNKIRTAKYVVGNPIRRVCSSHHNGFCKELGKKVKEAMDYSTPVLNEYTDHLRVAGVIRASEEVTSKESLREAFLKCPEKPADVIVKEAAPIDMGKVQNDFAAQLEKSAEQMQKSAAEQRFFAARPILAFMQNQMLKGKVGESLKESIREKFPSSEISKYAAEISKVASLQGLLGNLYVDVSYYKTPDEVISAIKTASTNPLYLVQSHKEHQFDNTLAKVASATGCSEFPRDGKIEKKVAFSYIKDLQVNNKIASNASQELLNRVLAGDCGLNVIKEAFDATLQYKKEIRTGGVKGTYAQGVSSKKASDPVEVKKTVLKALEAGLSVDLIEDKTATIVGTTEAVGMVRKALSELSEVSASCLSKCTSEVYGLSRTASLKPAQKCANCVLKSSTSCVKQSTRFAGSLDLDKAFFDLKEAGEPKNEVEKATKDVLFKENPDVERSDMDQKYEISDDSGMNITLDKMQEKGAGDLDIEMGNQGIDSHLI